MSGLRRPSIASASPWGKGGGGKGTATRRLVSAGKKQAYMVVHFKVLH